jgi:pre-mRNA-processing factor 6
VRTELHAGNAKAAEALMAKALQDCPDAGQLWAETINMAPRPQRKSRSGEAGALPALVPGCCCACL